MTLYPKDFMRNQAYSGRVWLSLAFAFSLALVTAHCAVLKTTSRTISSYAFGKRAYTCLVIDGGVMPLIVPQGAKLAEEGGSLTLAWTDDPCQVAIRNSTLAEVALFEMMNQPKAREEWQRYLTSSLRDPQFQFTPGEFQPNILAVNHWQIGATSVNFTLGGVTSTSFILLWRCVDGTTITVTMRCRGKDFPTHRDELYSMIGSSMLMEQTPAKTSP